MSRRLLSWLLEETVGFCNYLASPQVDLTGTISHERHNALLLCLRPEGLLVEGQVRINHCENQAHLVRPDLVEP